MSDFGIAEIRAMYSLGDISRETYERLMRENSDEPEKYIPDENWNPL